MNDQAGDRYRSLIGYLDADPDNPALLADAIRAGLDAGDVAHAAMLAERLRLVTPGAFEGDYLAGMAAMHGGDFIGAAERFAKLMGSDDRPSVRFNLAWSRAMTGEKQAALEILDAATIETIASAAMLRVQLLHEAGAFDEALAEGKAALARFPGDPGLLAAMATLALDVEDPALARDCALRAGDHPEALAAAGTLDLHAGDVAGARAAFERALALREHNPRAWIGRGLVGLADHDPAQAAHDLDRGAQQFGDHIGSWIAAGWAWYIAGDVAAAAQRFERALAIDPAFAETQGSLAVIDLARGNREAARAKASAALRLDRDCFAGALAQALLTSDDPGRAAAIVERAMTTPIDGGTMTLSAYLAGLTRPTLH